MVRDGDGWNIDGVAVDQDSGRLVYSRNVEGYNELTVGEFADATTIEEFPTPDLPGGLAGGVSWGPDAEQFAVSVTGRTMNTNVFVVETETGESRRWTHASTAGMPPEPFVEPGERTRYDLLRSKHVIVPLSLRRKLHLCGLLALLAALVGPVVATLPAAVRETYFAGDPMTTRLGAAAAVLVGTVALAAAVAGGAAIATSIVRVAVQERLR